MKAPPVKNLILWGVVIFVLFGIFTSPGETAGWVRQAFVIARDGLLNIVTFFQALAA